MQTELPEVIAAFFEISNGADTDRITQCFAPDAVVSDEQQSYRGHAAIQDWQHEVRRKFDFTVEPLSVTGDDGKLLVAARVAGNFPGSPVQLDHEFVLQDGRITMLRIS